MTVQSKLKEMGVEIQPMRIEILKCDSEDEILETWLRYRSEFLTWDKLTNTIINKKNGEVISKKDYMDNLFKQDLSVTYFQNAKLCISSSLFFREFIFHLWDLARWGLSSRDSPKYITRLVCSEELADIEGNVEAYKEFIQWKELYESGEIDSFDEMRGYLPLAHATEFVISLPVKQFIKYIAIYYKYFHEVLPESWKCVYTAVYDAEYKGGYPFRRWLNKIESYSSVYEGRRISSSLPVDKRGQEFISGNKIYEYVGKIGSGLFSQLIRHESIQTIGWIDFMVGNIRTLEVPNSKYPIPIWVHCDSQRMAEIIQVRNSWFASANGNGDNNSWTYIVNKYVKLDSKGHPKLEDNFKLFKFFTENGELDEHLVDKYKIDESTRIYKGYDRFWINPIVSEYPEIIIARVVKVGYSYIMDLYAQMFKKGYFKDNPGNPIRVQWKEWVKEGAKNEDYDKYHEVWEEYMRIDDKDSSRFEEVVRKAILENK